MITRIESCAAALREAAPIHFSARASWVAMDCAARVEVLGAAGVDVAAAEVAAHWRISELPLDLRSQVGAFMRKGWEEFPAQTWGLAWL